MYANHLFVFPTNFYECSTDIYEIELEYTPKSSVGFFNRSLLVRRCQTFQLFCNCFLSFISEYDTPLFYFLQQKSMNENFNKTRKVLTIAILVLFKTCLDWAQCVCVRTQLYLKMVSLWELYSPLRSHRNYIVCTFCMLIHILSVCSLIISIKIFASKLCLLFKHLII